MDRIAAERADRPGDPAGDLDDVGTSLLATAGRLLAEEGPAALTVRRIAGETGLSTMNVYSRFGGKHGVVEHLYLQGFGLLADCMNAVAATADPLADLRACGVAYRRFALDHPTLYSVMFEKAVPDYVPTPGAMVSSFATLQLLADRLERCMRAGTIRDGDPLQAAAIVWSASHGAVSLELKERVGGHVAIDWAAVYVDTCAAVVEGLRARRDTA